ncbi:MAG: HAD hydrolase-like protein, partial [Armatimonadetes bacterium]|nr:HAD hydrolase-like protein [Armatimonadota bacterium]
PNPGMLLRAAEDLHLDLSRSFIVGDNLSDLAAGRRVGTKAILVRTGSGETVAGQLAPGRADYVAADLADAAQWILGGT